MAADPIVIREEQEIQRLDSLFRAQKTAFAAEPMPTLEDRRAHLDSLRKALIAYRKRLAAAVSDDFGNRSVHETYAELMSSVQGIRYARRHLRGWMKPSRRRAGLLMATTKSRVFYQPKGVAGIIVPWNYPLALSIGPLTCALAAGNRVMLKMSEATPRVNEVFKEVLASAFDEDRVAVILGDVAVGRSFASTAFDHLLFTGSTEVGRHVMRAASENLTPVTLELGGKSPTIVTDDVPMDMAAERICFGKAFNAGQTCVAPDYVLCPENRVDEFVRAFEQAFTKMYPDLHRNLDYTCIVNERQHRRLLGYLDDARAMGAEVIELNPGGQRVDPNTRKLPLQVVVNVKPGMRLMQEEIFGPILPVVPYGDIEEAIRFINERPRPLAINLFDTNPERRQRVIDATHSGGLCINDAVSHFIAEDLPFGGVGDSGMGHYHAYEGFLTFSHHKAVFSRPRLNTARPLYAPHGGWIQKLIFKLFLR
jgi:coniferyl-aldehyde dehydrogenase